MSEFLFQYYPVHPTTWVYLSSLLMIGVYFKFSRFWSVRNIDLVLLILLSPGLLMVHFGEQRAWQEQVASEIAATVAPGQIGEATSASAAGVADPIAAVEPATLGTIAVTAEPSLPVDGGDVRFVDALEALSGAEANVAAVEEELAATENDMAAETAALSGKSVMLIGYVWLLSVLGVFLMRLLLDPTMVRRPLLEPNLSTGGLAFLGCSLFVFLMANVINSPGASVETAGARSAVQANGRRHRGPDSRTLHRGRPP